MQIWPSTAMAPRATAVLGGRRTPASPCAVLQWPATGERDGVGRGARPRGTRRPEPAMAAALEVRPALWLLLRAGKPRCSPQRSSARTAPAHALAASRMEEGPAMGSKGGTMEEDRRAAQVAAQAAPPPARRSPAARRPLPPSRGHARGGPPPGGEGEKRAGEGGGRRSGGRGERREWRGQDRNRGKSLM